MSPALIFSIKPHQFRRTEMPWGRNEISLRRLFCETNPIYWTRQMTLTAKWQAVARMRIATRGGDAKHGDLRPG